MREYYSRVLAYIACGASIAAGTYTQYFSYGILWMVPYALLYPHLAYHLGQRFRQPVGECLGHDRGVVVVLRFEISGEGLYATAGGHDKGPDVILSPRLQRRYVVGQ